MGKIVANLSKNFFTHPDRCVVKNSLLNIRKRMIPKKLRVQFSDVFRSGKGVSTNSDKNLKTGSSENFLRELEAVAAASA